jgi:serine/threonine protein kinase
MYNTQKYSFSSNIKVILFSYKKVMTSLERQSSSPAILEGKDEVEENLSKKIFLYSKEKYIIRHVLGDGAFGMVVLIDELNEEKKDGTNKNEDKSTSTSKRKEESKEEKRTTSLRAVKIVSKQLVILKELEIWKKISYTNPDDKSSIGCSPYIICLYDFFESRNKVYYIMEYFEGKDLYFFLTDPKNANKVPLKKLITLFRQICEAEKYLVDRGIVHRDLKIENVMVYFDDKKKPTVKLIDLGFAQEKKSCLFYDGTKREEKDIDEKGEVSNKNTSIPVGYVEFRGTEKYTSKLMKQLKEEHVSGKHTTYFTGDEAFEFLVAEDTYQLSQMFWMVLEYGLRSQDKNSDIKSTYSLVLGVIDKCRRRAHFTSFENRSTSGKFTFNDLYKTFVGLDR